MRKINKFLLILNHVTTFQDFIFLFDFGLYSMLKFTISNLFNSKKIISFVFNHIFETLQHLYKIQFFFLKKVKMNALFSVKRVKQLSEGCTSTLFFIGFHKMFLVSL